jgi:uncharacterized membrane protein
MMGYGAGLGFGLGGWLMMFGGLAVMAGLILLVVWALSRADGSHAAQPSSPQVRPAAEQPDAMDVLRMRLARGEVTVEDFASARQALEAGR